MLGFVVLGVCVFEFESYITHCDASVSSIFIMAISLLINYSIPHLSASSRDIFFDFLSASLVFLVFL